MLTELFSDKPSWEEVAASLPNDANDTDRLMAAIYYHCEIAGAGNVDTSFIVEEYFRRAYWGDFSNISATANHCSRRGWISEAGWSGRNKLWQATRTGSNAIRTRIGRAN